jgi:hypothetical protein
MPLNLTRVRQARVAIRTPPVKPRQTQAVTGILRMSPRVRRKYPRRRRQRVVMIMRMTMSMKSQIRPEGKQRQRRRMVIWMLTIHLRQNQSRNQSPRSRETMMTDRQRRNLRSRRIREISTSVSLLRSHCIFSHLSHHTLYSATCGIIYAILYNDYTNTGLLCS